MTTNWKGGNGQWQTANKWSNGAPTTPQSFAVINAAGTYTVTIGSGLEYNVGAISLNAAGATLSIAGILDLKNKLTVSKGTVTVSGEIHGGTIMQTQGLKLRGATLAGVSFDGIFNLDAGATAITISDGLSLRGAKGTGAGAFKLANASQVTLAGDQSLGGGTLTLTGATVLNSTGMLTIGTVERFVDQTTKAGSLDSVFNNGTFVAGKGSTLTVTGMVANTGQFTDGGGVVTVTDFSNAATGQISVFAGSNFTAGNFDNAGTLTANNAYVFLDTQNGGGLGTLNITNSTVVIELPINSSSVSSAIAMLAGKNDKLEIVIQTDNTGNTIDLAKPSGFADFNYILNITGGTLTTDAPVGGDLTDVIVQGPLTVANGLTITGTTFTGADGTGPGTINLDNYALYAGNTALDNVHVVAAAKTLLQASTLGTNFSVKAAGAFSLGYRGWTVVNNGLLEAGGQTAGVFKIAGRNFTNNGTIQVDKGGSFGIIQAAFRNLTYGGTATGLTLAGGTYDIGAGGALMAGGRSLVIKTLEANVALEGSGASFLGAGLFTVGAQGALTLQNRASLTVNSTFTIEAQGTVTLGSGGTLKGVSTLAIDEQGVLALQTGTGFANISNVALDGEISLGGGNLSASSTAVSASGAIDGHGGVLGAVANAGTINASGGTLTISQGVTGTGAGEIENNATLSFGANVSAGQTLTFEGAAGTLTLGNAGGFAGTIAGFAPGNAIDMINTKATAIAYHAGTDMLTVKNKGAVIATLQLSGTYTGDTFGLVSDGKGGTEITVTAAIPAVHRFIEAVAAFSPPNMASTGLPATPDSSQLTPAVAVNHAHFG